ncbi:hypothetical protein SK128_005017 [Halocaridina rubra]|uniref:Uncharacterized protein n=1 Tax=Halocaridina rubra TaxID=373956 RepID=A0AAN8ZXB3_HALRR
MDLTTDPSGVTPTHKPYIREHISRKHDKISFAGSTIGVVCELCGRRWERNADQNQIRNRKNYGTNMLCGCDALLMDV